MSADKPHRHMRHPTPCCGKEVDAATVVSAPGEPASKDAPGPGDFSICIYCGAWLRFIDHQGRSRKFEAEDILALTDAQREMMRTGTRMIRELHAAGLPPPPRGAATPFIRTRKPRR